MNNRSNFRAALSGLLAFVFLFFGGTMAHAVAPLESLDGLITDQAGVLEGQTADLEAAQARFHEATGGQFYVVFIDSFGGADPREWATTTGQNAGLESRDLLLVVSPADPGYWLEHGGDLTFTPEQENALVATMDNSLDAGLEGAVPWQAAVANIIGAFQNNIVVDETTVHGTEPAPEGVVNDGGSPAAPAEPGVTAPGPDLQTQAPSGGLPTVARVVLIALGALAALFALWLLLGKYNEKRLAKRAEQNPFNL